MAEIADMPRRYAAAILCSGLALGPLLYVVAFASHVDLAHEFVFYRIGDALAIAGGERQHVHPVQGLPTALLSKLVVAMVPNVLSPEGLRLYSLLWSIGLLLPLGASIWFAWAKLPALSAVLQAFILALPWWFGTGSLRLLAAPEYWQGEWAYLAITLVIVSEIRHYGPPRYAPLLFGLWAGIGAALKITMLPLVFLLLYFIRPTGKNVLVCFAALAACYAAIAVAYMSYLGWGIRLLGEQALFYLMPNHSAMYASFLKALGPHPAIAGLLLGSLIVLRTKAALVIVPWALVHGYTVFMRPHDTSMTSFGLFLGFALAVGVLLLPRLRLQALAAIVACFVALAYITGFSAVRTWLAMPSIRTSVEDQQRASDFFAVSSRKKTIWIVPSNDWNATYGPQGIGYNGGLGHRPLGEATPTFHALYPKTFIVGTSELELSYVRGELQRGAVVYWTRPPDSTLPREILDGAHITEKRGYYRGREWIFGKAVHDRS